MLIRILKLKDSTPCARSFGRNRNGSIATMVALAVPIIFFLTAGVIDFATLLRQKAALQVAVDAAVVAAAKEMSMADTKADNLSAVIASVVNAHFEAQGSAGDATGIGGAALNTRITSTLDIDTLTVSADVVQDFVSPFGDGLGIRSTTLNATASAQVVGKPNICVLALNDRMTGTIELQRTAHVVGQNCAIFANSKSSNGIMAKLNSILQASQICVAGGYQGVKANFSPTPYVDCPTFEDPLAARVEPAVTACDPTLPTEISDVRTINAGAYCGLRLRSGAAVTMEPGIYSFIDAPLIVEDDASLTGLDVGLYFRGDNANLVFEARSSVRLEAQKTGDLAGLLIFASRSQSEVTRYDIFSENAQYMVGTIYIPTAELRIDGDAKVGGDSAYTALVVNRFTAYGGPKIVLNSNYNETDVPVPDGIRGAGQPVRLIN